MPESSDPSPPERQPDPAAPAKSSDAAARPRPRANPPNAQQAQQTKQTGTFSFNDLVHLARSLTGEEPPPSPNASARTLISRDQKKFSRQKSQPFAEPSDSAADSPSDAPSEPEESPKSLSSPAPSASISASAPLRKSVSVAFARGSGGGQSRRVRRSVLMPFVLAQLAMIALVFVGWLIFRAPREEPDTARAVPPAPSKVSAASAAPLSPRAFELIDRMMEAEKAGDFRKALDLCEQIRRTERRAPGLDYRQALLSAKAGGGPQVVVALNHSLAANEELVNSHNLMAAMMLQQGNLAGAIREYEAAAQAGPFEDKAFFYWGEALRRMGQPQAALIRLDQAIDRARDPADEAFYQSKVRLTLIEMNREQEFAEELRTKLALNPPPVDWLVTAAAVELHRGKFDAAAGYLDQASKMVPPKLLEDWLRDSYLFGFAREKTLARFYGQLAPPAAPVSAETAPSAAEPQEPLPGVPQGPLPGLTGTDSPEESPSSSSGTPRAPEPPKPSASPAPAAQGK
jgi:tetratricopeptide (TPR) repeat protein